jgi:hypothetical protein
MNKSVCPHVISEHKEIALPYCQMCAPKEIFKLRAENDHLRKSLESAPFSNHEQEIKRLLRIIQWAKIYGKFGHGAVDHDDWENELDRRLEEEK